MTRNGIVSEDGSPVPPEVNDAVSITKKRLSGGNVCVVVPLDLKLSV